MGVPADDAVSLSDNQNRLLRLEERYLKPFLTRKLALGTGARAGVTGSGCVAVPLLRVADRMNS